MASPYKKRGVYYAPTWRNPRTGELHQACSLGTKDPSEAEVRWIRLQAERVALAPPADAKPGTQVELPGTGGAGEMMLSEAVDRYIAAKHDIGDATKAAYRQYARLFIQRERLRDRLVSAMEPPAGSAALQEAFDTCVAQEVRLHTLQKWIIGVVFPALKYSVAMGWLRAAPKVPAFTSDYQEHRPERDLTVEEFIAFRNALPERVPVFGVEVHARLLADVGAMTGMHTKDLALFVGRYWRRLGQQWYRVNSKGAKRYRPEWFLCEPWMQMQLERAWEERGGWGPDDGILVAETAKIEEVGWPKWDTSLGHVFRRASDRAGLNVRITPIWLRHFFAAMMRDQGWTQTETAKVLGNSGSIVERVYAALPNRRISERVAESRLSGVLMEATGELPSAAEERRFVKGLQAAMGTSKTAPMVGDGRHAESTGQILPLSLASSNTADAAEGGNRKRVHGGISPGSKSGSKRQFRRRLSVGNKRERAEDLRIKSPQLYQLSYGLKPPKPLGSETPEGDNRSVPGSKTGNKATRKVPGDDAHGKFGGGVDDVGPDALRNGAASEGTGTPERKRKRQRKEDGGGDGQG